MSFKHWKLQSRYEEREAEEVTKKLDSLDVETEKRAKEEKEEPENDKKEESKTDSKERQVNGISGTKII